PATSGRHSAFANARRRCDRCSSCTASASSEWHSWSLASYRPICRAPSQLPRPLELWRHRRSGSGAALAAIAPKCPRLTRRVDLQRLGLGRSRERLLPGQCHGAFARAVGSGLLHSNSGRAAAPHYSRPRIPGSSAAPTRTRNRAEPTASARIDAVNTSRTETNTRNTLIRGASMKLLLPLILSASPFAAVAQSRLSSGQPPADAPSPKTTEVMVILTAKDGVTRQQIMNVMPDELRDTLKLYLDGRIRQWYSRGDGRGVIFFIDAKTVEEAHAAIDALPLSKENLMDHEYIPVGPLMPLSALIAR